MIPPLSVTIAQLLPPAAAPGSGSVPRLPAAPLFERFILEQPWPLAIALAAIGAIAAWNFSRRGRPRQSQSSLLAGAALAAAVVVAANSVTTARERCAALTRDAVQHVLAGDAASLAPMLRSDLLVTPFALSRDRVLSAVTNEMRSQYAVKDWSILSLDAAQDSPDAIRTQVHLRATPVNSLYAYPAASWWTLTWQRAAAEPTRWILTQIECQQIDGVSNPASIRP